MGSRYYATGVQLGIIVGAARASKFDVVERTVERIMEEQHLTADGELFDNMLHRILTMLSEEHK
jgi:hypothetical protein